MPFRPSLRSFLPMVTPGVLASTMKALILRVPPLASPMRADLAVDASPDNNLFYVADDRFRLSERVKRLMKRTAHAEFPHSRTRHLVSNVRIRKRIGDDLEVSSAFITYRTKDGVTDTYFGSNRDSSVLPPRTQHTHAK